MIQNISGGIGSIEVRTTEAGPWLWIARDGRGAEVARGTEPMHPQALRAARAAVFANFRNSNNH